MKKLRALILMGAMISALSISAHAGDGPTTVQTTAPAKPSPFAGLSGLFRPFGKVAKGTADWAGSVTVGTAEELGRTSTGAVHGSGKMVSGSGQAYQKGLGKYLTDTLDDNK